jgi:hypothetical protein
MNKETAEFKERFYTDAENLHNILEYMNPKQDIYREVAFLNKPKNKEYQKIAFRGVTFSQVAYDKIQYNYLTRVFSFRDFFNNDANIYTSVALLRKLPTFSFINSERTLQTRPFFEQEYKDYIIRKDIFIDTDLEDKNATTDTFYTRLMQYKKLIYFLYTNGVDFETSFSGSRGFKTVIHNHLELKETDIILKKLACFFYGMKYTNENIIKISKREDNIFDLIGCDIPSKLMKCTNTLCITGDKLRFVTPMNKQNWNRIIDTMQTDKYKIFEDYREFKNILQNINYNYSFDVDRETIQQYKDNLFNFIVMIHRSI